MRQSAAAARPSALRVVLSIMATTRPPWTCAHNAQDHPPVVHNRPRRYVSCPVKPHVAPQDCCSSGTCFWQGLLQVETSKCMGHLTDGFAGSCVNGQLCKETSCCQLHGRTALIHHQDQAAQERLLHCSSMLRLHSQTRCLPISNDAGMAQVQW